MVIFDLQSKALSRQQLMVCPVLDYTLASNLTSSLHKLKNTDHKSPFAAQSFLSNTVLL